MNTLLLNKTDVGALIDLDAVFEAVKDGYAAFSSGKVVQPDFMSIVKPGTHTGFDFKGGLNLGNGMISMKSSSGGYPDNPKIGLPTGLNMVYLYEADTSALKCIMDGTWITGCRTAAAGAVSVAYLARKDAKCIAMIGAGNQARRQLRAIARVRQLEKVYVWSYNPESVEGYIKDMKEEFDFQFIPCQTAKEAIEVADIIVTTTRARRGAIVQKDWLKPGTHIVAIGSDMPDKQEVSEDVLGIAKVVDDSIAACIKNGETHHAVEKGIITKEMIYGEIGEIILGNKPGRENDTEITLFDSVGMAIQDNVMATAIYELALQKNMGVNFDFLL